MSRFVLSFETDNPQIGRAAARIRLNPQLKPVTDGLTPLCTGPSELDSAIRSLKAELDALSKQAHAKFRNHWRSNGKSL